MISIAGRLRAFCYIDGPNTTDAAAIAYRNTLGSRRAMVIDPWLKVSAGGDATRIQAGSAHFAGLRAKIDNDRGFWWSISNNELRGVVGLARPVDFTFGDRNARANHLNENEVTTVILQAGYRAWGNRTCSADAKWAFESSVRTADILHDSLTRAHRWAVDRNITKTYVADVVEGVNAYIGHLVRIGALIGGKCWADSDLNSSAELAKGKVYFDFDFTPPTPAEHITFRSHKTDSYFKEIFK